MKLIFLFTDKTSFELNLPAKLNRKTFMAKVVEFQAFCLNAIADHKGYASGYTSFKIPTYKPSWIGLDTGDGTVLPILDEKGNYAMFKGNTILNKVGKGKDTVLSLNADFPRFIWSKVAPLVGEVKDIGRHIGVLPMHRNLTQLLELRSEAKEKAAIKQLASGEAKTGVQSVNVESVLAD